MIPHATPTPEDREVVLLVCLLFTGLSSLQRDTSQAVAHSSNGIQLFYRWRYWDQATPSGQRANCILPSGAIVSLITHIEASFRNRALTVSPWRGMHIHQGCLVTNLHTKAFNSAEEAFSDLEPMLTGIVDILDSSLTQRSHILCETGAPCFGLGLLLGGPNLICCTNLESFSHPTRASCCY